MPSWDPGDRWDPGNPENRDRTRRLKSELRALLLTWDPIDVADVPEAQDEYDGYIGPLLHLLHGGASVDEVDRYLGEVILAGTGMWREDDRERAFAESLTAWWTQATVEKP